MQTKLNTYRRPSSVAVIVQNFHMGLIPECYYKILVMKAMNATKNPSTIL